MTGGIKPRILDITRLAGRVGRAPLTGVDRVERAYLRAITQAPGPSWLVARTRLGWIVVPGSAGAQVLGWIDDPATLPRPHPTLGLMSAALLRRVKRAPLVTALRRSALHRLTDSGMPRWLATTCPQGADWFSVGHTNLRQDLFSRIRALPGFRVIAMVHDTIPLDHPAWSGKGAPERFGQALNAVSRCADLILCPSAQTAEDVRRWTTGKPLPSLLVAHLGLEMRPGGQVSHTMPAQPYFVILGTIEPRKGIGFALDVWARLRENCADDKMPRLLLIGRRGWIGADLAARLDRDPLMGRHVLELSGRTDPEVTSLVRGAHALLAPSRSEGFGLPVGEAALLGVPVLATDLPVTHEFLGNYARYLPPEDLQAWAGAVLALSALPHSETKMSPPPLPDWTDHFNRVFNHLR